MFAVLPLAMMAASLIVSGSAGAEIERLRRPVSKRLKAQPAPSPKQGLRQRQRDARKKNRRK